MSPSPRSLPLLWWSGLAAVLLACLLAPGSARAQAEPVEDLRRALNIGTDLTPLTPPDLEKRKLQYRRQALEASLKELHTVTELYEALRLPNWADNPASAVALNRKIIAIDLELHAKVRDRLRAALQAGLKDASTKVATITFVAEIARGLRLDPQADPFELSHDLLPEVARLTTDGDPQVRQAAVRALGQINPIGPPATAPAAEPDRLKEVTAALLHVLTHDAVNERRAAAEALGQLAATIADLEKATHPGVPTPVRRGDLIRTDQEIAGLAGRAAADADVQVRRLGLEALLQVAAELEKRIQAPKDFFEIELKHPPFPRFLFDEPPSADSEAGQDIALVRNAVERQLQFYEPLIAALSKQGQVLAACLEDGESSIRLVSRRALEHLAGAHQRIERLRESVPPLRTGESTSVPAVPAAGGAKNGGGPKDLLLQGLRPGRQVMSRGLADPSPKVRLAAAEFLEMLGGDAEPATGALVQALRDPDAFVRWTAARALTHIAPLQAARAVPALARAVTDPDLDARMAAVAALQRYGVLAAEAAPALARAVLSGDAESRVAAIGALPAVLPGYADGQTPAQNARTEQAVDALASAVKNRDDLRVRQAAALALGQIPGPAARRALPALREALHDADSEVRRRAGEALLTIQRR